MKQGLTFIVLFFCLTANAQNYQIKGVVQDGSGTKLIGAVAVALNPADSVMVSYAVTDDKGVFQLTGLSKNDVDLQITYIGFGTLQRRVTLGGQSKVVDLGTITMQEEGRMLETVTISAEYVPIKVTKDTLEFNADAFKTQPNAVVEDLLKKLPGVEVDNDGGIKVKGEDVKAVTVDGKEFFGKDPKMATRNLPADAIKKVQIFDKKSRNAEFTGIDDGQEEKTINLELKENRKKGSFGNVMAGYGTDQRYEGKALVNRFSKKIQVSVLGGLNNLNNSGVNVNDFVSMTGGSSGGGGFRGVSMNSGIPLSFGQNNIGETKSITGGLNLNHDFGKKNRINFSYYLTKSQTDLRQNTFTNSFLTTGTLLNDKFSNSLSGSFNHNFNTVADIKLDSLTEVTLTGTVGLRSGDNNSNLKDSTLNAEKSILNLNDQLKTTESGNNTYSLSLNLRRKLAKKGRSISFDGGMGRTDATTEYKILSSVFGRDLQLLTDRSVFQDQEQNSDNSYYNLSLSYTEPVARDLFLSATAARRNNNNDIIKDFYDINPDIITFREFNEALSRSFDNTFVYNTVGTSLRLNKETYSASAGLDFQNSNLDGKPSVGEPINRPFNYFLPRANVEIDKLNMRINYSTSVREPSIDQLQPVVDNSDPLNVYKGNPGLVPEYRHNLRISYNFFDQFNFRGLFANVRLGYTKNRITTSNFVDPVSFIRTSTPLNTENEKTLSGSFNYTSPLNAIKAKYRLGLNSSLTNGINFINQAPNIIDRWSHGGSFTLENKLKSRVDISGTARLSYNTNIYKSNENLNTEFLNQTYEGFLAVYPGKDWAIDTRMEYNIYGQGSFDSSTKVALWQASVSKGFMKNKVNVKLRVFDILNQNQGVSRSASETFISNSVSNTIGRYFMLNVTYSLNSLGGQQQQSQVPTHIMIRQ